MTFSGAVRAPAAMAVSLGLVTGLIAFCIRQEAFSERPEAELQRAYREALRRSGDKQEVPRLLALLPKASGSDPSEPTYMFEGDVAISEPGLRQYIKQRTSGLSLRITRIDETKEAWEYDLPGPLLELYRDLGEEVEPDLGPVTMGLTKRSHASDYWEKLTPNVLPDRRMNFWNWGDRNLSYTIDVASFKGRNHWAVLQAFEEAAKDWEGVCGECQVHFEYVDPGPGTPQPAPKGGKPTFVIKYKPDGDYFASAFFPDAPQKQRFLLISSDWFHMRFPRAGILRHEIGHILGYIHEFVGSPEACVREDPPTPDIARYRLHATGASNTSADPLSVMQFPCIYPGGLGMTLSEGDRAGHRKLYTWRWEPARPASAPSDMSAESNLSSHAGH